MVPGIRFGKTELKVSRIALGAGPFGCINKARGWDPSTSKGRKTAISTVNAAIDAGINYIDTAPSYGESESIVGEALQGKREKVIIATKVKYRGMSPDEVIAGVEASLKCLRTDVIDVIQFHGGMYVSEEVDLILDGGLLDALMDLREKGSVRFIGFTVTEPWTSRPLVASGRFDVVQMHYNLINQSAALHALNDAQKADMGITVMRPMTSGILQRIATYIAPQWDESDIYEMALKFLLSDSRVHTINVGMRWPHEVAKNVSLADTFEPPFDMADIPRLTREIHRTEDAMYEAAKARKA